MIMGVGQNRAFASISPEKMQGQYAPTAMAKTKPVKHLGSPTANNYIKKPSASDLGLNPLKPIHAPQEVSHAVKIQFLKRKLTVVNKFECRAY